MVTREVSKYQDKIITIPNILSFFRVCLIPFFVWLYTFKESYFWAAVILFVSAVTDVVDGIIARKFNMISDLGKVFDPIADKVTQFVTLVCLAERFKYMIIPLSIMAIKEIFTGITSLVVINRSDEVHGAVWHGKLTTVLLYSTMILHIIWWGIPPLVSNVSITLSISMMIFSGVLYISRNFAILKDCKEQKNS